MNQKIGFILGQIAMQKNKYLEARQHFLAGLQDAASSQDLVHEHDAYFGLYCCDYALEFENKEHLERYRAAIVFHGDTANDLEIAWREAALGRLEINERKQIQTRLETAVGRDCLAAARLLLLEGDDKAALETLNRWQDETWFEDGLQKTQQRPAEHTLLEGMALRNAGKKSVSMRALETALGLAKNAEQTVLKAEITLAISLVSAAPSKSALEQLRSLGASGHAIWLRKLYPGTLESLEFNGNPQGAMIRTLGAFGLEENGKLSPWKEQKTRDLLALLICADLEEGTGHLSREQILNTIWGDVDSSTADGAFRVTVSRLRDSLGNAAKIERNNQGHYGLQNAKLDVTLFLESFKKHDLEGMVVWYNGDFLAGIKLEKTGTLREKFRADWRKALLQLAFESQDSRAANLFETLLENDPLDFEALQGLAKSWESLGTNLRLLRVLEKSKDHFLQQVGVAPKELLELLAQVSSTSFKNTLNPYPQLL
jgi:DNA-binding SARP family transcriptional activator